MMRIRLTCHVLLNELIPPSSQWYVMISPRYPDGSIRLYPDKDNGIKRTFQHQNYNTEVPSRQWWSGDPCLNTTHVSWGRHNYSLEPREPKERLRWHILRCIDWITAAADGTLVNAGDPFEFPAFPSKTLYRIVFNEGALSFSDWTASDHRHGIVELKTLEQLPEVYAVFNFLGHESQSPEIKWGTRIATSKREDQTGIWLMLNAIPVMVPWQIPSVFSELFNVCVDQGHDVRKEIAEAYVKIRRKGKSMRFVMLGFPVPQKIGEPPSLIHWIAFEFANPKKINGFKGNSDALFLQELNVLTSGDKRIKWVPTENWNKDQLTARGLLPQSLSKANILLIGAGALGSLLSQQLVRLGCEKLTAVDEDILTSGNMSRHVLTLHDVGKNKAEALSQHLNAIFPFVNASFEPYSIQQTLHLQPAFFDKFDIIVDVTANDSALEFLSGHLSDTGKTFISLSLGFKAHRLFCFSYRKNEGKSIRDSFHEKAGQLLHEEREMFSDEPEVIEGIGCWHPLFPSRLDDIEMLSSAAIKVIESSLSTGLSQSFSIVEKQYDVRHSFSGITIRTL